MNSFTIKDLENLTGIKAHTIRIWEQRYDFLKPQRTDTNIRYYSNHELKKILNIALLNRYGFKISHISKMSEDDIHVKILGINNSEAQQERVINELIQKMIDLELISFELMIDEHIRVKGIEKTIHKIIFPFMERIGVLWVTGHINPAQEHLVSNIIRQKVIVGTQAISNLIPIKKTALLFLPEGEFHELGILYIQYLLKNRGIGVLYLGTNIPLEYVDYVVKYKAPDFIYTHLTSVSTLFSFDRFIQQASKRFNLTPLIISGRLASIYDKSIPLHVHLKKSVQEVTAFITELA
ncbi:MAG: MerR family transcriptional regulator [Chitinophagaceae bacterium]|nr:MAG: MerR family transcriptional regulator [Chitinophagaceae bacterium]